MLTFGLVFKELVPAVRYIFSNLSRFKKDAASIRARALGQSAARVRDGSKVPRTANSPAEGNAPKPTTDNRRPTTDDRNQQQTK